MTLNDIVQRTIESQLKQADVEAFCEQERISIETFCDDFARYVAACYVDDHFSYESADAAIAGLFYHFDYGVPKFASSVFECFDAAEYRCTQGFNPGEIARPLVKEILYGKQEPSA
jgi:hypothetical protein